MSHLHLSLEDDDPWFIEQRLFDVLNEFLEPSDNLSTETAIERIDALFPTNRQDQPAGEDKEDAATFFYNAWPVVPRVAQQISYADPAQDKLAELLNALSKFTSKTPTVTGSYNTEWKLWQDLPELGPAFREAYDELERQRIQNHLERKRNINAFMARLTRDGTIDLSEFGKSAVSEALGGQMVYRHAHAHNGEVDYEIKPSAELDTQIAVANDWITFCGHIMVNKIGGTTEGLTHPKSSSGTEKLSWELWNFWKRRFEEVSTHENLEQDTKRFAGDAKTEMERLEAGSA